MALLSCRDLSFAYDGAIVVEGLRFSVEEGDYLCIVGENGSGKSTLIKGIIGLKKPLQGDIDFGEGLKVQQLGYLPQQTAVQRDFPASVFEVVLSGCLNQLGFRPFFSRAQKKLALENLERIGALGLKDRCYRELSGGQQQRVLLARALCASQRLILLDEPVAGLDPLVTTELYQLIQMLNQRMGLTIVMVSHDVESVIRYASHILHLQKSQVFFGTTEEYLQSPIGRGYLGGHKDV